MLAVADRRVDEVGQRRRHVRGQHAGERHVGAAQRDQQPPTRPEREAIQHLVDERTRAQRHERDTLVGEVPLDQHLVEEVRDLRGLVAAQDPGKHEPAHPRSQRRVDQVPVPHRVGLRSVGTPPAGVAGRAGDHRIDAREGRAQGRRVHHVATDDLDAESLQLGGVTAGAHQRTHGLAAFEEGGDHLAPEVAGASDDEDR